MDESGLNERYSHHTIIGENGMQYNLTIKNVVWPIKTVSKEELKINRSPAYCWVI